MKRYISSIICACTLCLAAGCSDSTGSATGPEEQVLLEGVDISLQESDETVAATKATSDYAVNENIDPTKTMVGRESWELDVTINNSNGSFGPQSATFTWDAVNNYWTPGTDIFFPNYTRQEVELTLHPVPWSAIAFDQRTDILGQDVLIQDGTTSITVYPAHIPEIEVKHAHSMLDFRFLGIEDSDINTISVEVGGDTYYPYKVPGTTSPEYLLIIPVGSSSPIIRMGTPGGANYYQTTVDKITNTQVNTCYCFTLRGLELQLAEITIENWATGRAMSGDYTSETSYPTFRGIPEAQITLFYDNGLAQDIILDSQGEYTGRPSGRTITGIRYLGVTNEPDPPLVLSNTIIDLTPYL